MAGFDHERFKNIAAAVQSLVVAIALILGGVWSAYTFSALGSIEKARAEVEKLRAELAARPDLAVALSAESVVDPSNNTKAILIRARLRNAGTVGMELPLPRGHLRVARMVSSKDGEITLESTRKGSAINVSDQGPFLRVVQRVPAAGERVLEYLVPVQLPGLYLVTFDLPITPHVSRLIDKPLVGQTVESDEILKQEGLQASGESRWIATTAVVVR